MATVETDMTTPLRANADNSNEVLRSWGAYQMPLEDDPVSSSSSSSSRAGGQRYSMTPLQNTACLLSVSCEFECHACFPARKY